MKNTTIKWEPIILSELKQSDINRPIAHIEKGDNTIGLLLDYDDTNLYVIFNTKSKGLKVSPDKYFKIKN